MIIGMGVDLAEVERIRGAIERHGEPFLRRVYTAAEREYCERFRNKYERYAGRFAAKEAAMKALGTGWRRGVRWVDFEVVREKGGRPTIRLDGAAKKIAEELGVKRIALSITHTEAQALAQVIFEELKAKFETRNSKSKERILHRGLRLRDTEFTESSPQSGYRFPDQIVPFFGRDNNILPLIGWKNSWDLDAEIVGGEGGGVFGAGVFGNGVFVAVEG